MANTLRLTRFGEVDLSDPFFDSLKAQYVEFPVWFAKKSAEPVYVVDDAGTGGIRGFVYLKVETGSIDDVSPPLPPARRLKVGTLKVNAKGTKLGERIIKRIFDHAILEAVDEVYVTVFDTHATLIALFERYGFVERGSKTSPNGTEKVLVRSLTAVQGDRVKDYPRMHTAGKKKWLLAIYPEYHTKLFPDSILRNEDPDKIEDVPHTNTIHKVYIAKLALTRMKAGDLVVIYRTTDHQGPAYYRSVATSVCVIEGSYSRKNFKDVEAFIAFAGPHSVFPDAELREWFNGGEQLYAVKMTYNVGFASRPIRGTLLDAVGVAEQPRWDLKPLTDNQFRQILVLGGVNESLIVD